MTEAISKWNAAYDHLDGVSDFSVADNRALRQAMEPFIRQVTIRISQSTSCVFIPISGLQLHALSKPLTAEQRQTLRPPPPLEVHTRLSPSDTMLCKILPRFSQYHKVIGGCVIGCHSVLYSRITRCSTPIRSVGINQDTS